METNGNATGYLIEDTYTLNIDASKITNLNLPSVRSNLAKDLRAFHTKFGFNRDWKPTVHNLEQRGGMMAEEVDEYFEAVALKDKIKIVDALVDLVYFAIGTADLLDVNFDAHWQAVQEANMKKERGLNPNRPNTGGLDAIKPVGWEPPEKRHEELLAERGFEIVQ